MGTTNYISNPRSREFPNLPETEQLKLLSEEVERVTLPHLRSIDSMDRLYQLTMQEPPPFSEGYEAHFRLELAMGNFDRARALLNKHRGWWFDDDDLFDDDVPAYSEQTRQLCHLFEKEEFQRIAQLFHQWEAAAAKDYGVQHLWQPSPFPFELGRRGKAARRAELSDLWPSPPAFRSSIGFEHWLCGMEFIAGRRQAAAGIGTCLFGASPLQAAP